MLAYSRHGSALLSRRIKMKQYLYMLIILVTIAQASAWEDNQTFTQRDIDRINTDGINNQTLDCHKETIRIRAPTFRYSCQTIEQIDNNNYRVIRRTNDKSFTALNVQQYLNRESLQRIKSVTRDIIGAHIYNTVEETKGTIQSYQTARSTNNYRIWMYNYDPF